MHWSQNTTIGICQVSTILHIQQIGLCSMRCMLISLTLLAVVKFSYADDGVEPTIASFKIGKVGLGTKIQDFSKNYPNAVQQKTDNVTQSQEVYMVEPKGMDCLQATFLNGTAYRVSAIWTEQDLDKIGGYETLMDKLEKKFGVPHANSPGVQSRQPLILHMFWTDVEQNPSQMLTFIVKNKNASISLVDVVVLNKIKESKRKSARTGIDD